MNKSTSAKILEFFVQAYLCQKIVSQHKTLIFNEEVSEERTHIYFHL